MANNSQNRRGFILKGLLTLFAGILGKCVMSGENASGIETEGEILKTHVYKGRPPVEPLDTMVCFGRSDNNNERAMTHEIISLLHEEKGTKSYPWTIYSHLTTHHVEGDACVFCSRLHKNGRGWSCGLHSEVFSNAPMVGLGLNVEMSNLYNGSEQTVLYGVNIMACGPNPCQSGIVIKNNGSGPGAVFEKQISLESNGLVGIDLPAKFDVGIQMHGNAIALDSEGKIKLRYSNGRIEFLNGDKCIGHINVEEEDHKI